MNPGLRSTTYDVNDLFSTSDQKSEIEKDKTQSWPFGLFCKALTYT